MELFKNASFQIASGGCAGFTEVCLMYPLDLMKTRMQLHVRKGSSDLYRYHGLADCFLKIYKSEGIGGFYKGILPPILAETPKRATKFFSFEQYKQAFTADAIPLPLTYSLAGLCSGLTEALVINPFEVVKVKLQAQRKVSLLEQESIIASARKIIADGGLLGNGINRGLSATLGRDGVWNMVYFGLYHSVKTQYPPPTDPTLNVLYRLLLGFVAGSLASAVNIPFDVAKSRIQGPQPASGRKYFSVFQSISLVYRQEGYFALYNGLLPKIMKLGPGGAIMLIVYETVFDFLKKTFP